MKKYPTIEQCDFDITAEQDDLEIVGNCSAIDEETDKATAEWICDQLNSGNVWAWARVTVKCSWNGFEGEDRLGGCSYESESDFKTPGGYYDDMKAESYRAMCQKIDAKRNALESL